jgi:hypothetical protein
MRRSRKLPFASGGTGLNLIIRDGDWLKIEKACGEVISADVRAAILEATQKFVYWESFERKAEPVAKAQELIEVYNRAAVGLQQAMLRGSSDAGAFARLLVTKHFQDPQLSDKVGSSYVPRFDALIGVLASFQLACGSALRELHPPPSTQGILGDFGTPAPFVEGESWRLWILRLTDIMKENGLKWHVRKDADKSDQQSPFVALVCALQRCLPAECKPPYAPSAVPTAIWQARRKPPNLSASVRWSQIGNQKSSRQPE